MSVLVFGVEAREVEMPVIPMCARDRVLVVADVLEHPADAPSAAKVSGRRNAEAARREEYVTLLAHGRHLHVRLAVEPAVVAPNIETRHLLCAVGGCSGCTILCVGLLRCAAICILRVHDRRFCGSRHRRSAGERHTEEREGQTLMNVSHGHPPSETA